MAADARPEYDASAASTKDTAVQREAPSRLPGTRPIGRMPALILMSGEVLIESAAILDYLTSSDRAVHSCQSRESRAAGA